MRNIIYKVFVTNKSLCICTRSISSLINIESKIHNIHCCFGGVAASQASYERGRLRNIC